MGSSGQVTRRGAADIAPSWSTSATPANQWDAGTTCPSVVTPRNGSAKAFSALAYVFFHPSGIGSTILLAEPGRGGLTPYPPYLPGMMAIVETLLRVLRTTNGPHHTGGG